MQYESVIMWYLILGILTAFINGAVRKIEADALLGFAWILVWPLTPIGFMAKGISYLIKKF